MENMFNKFSVTTVPNTFSLLVPTRVCFLAAARPHRFEFHNMNFNGNVSNKSAKRVKSGVRRVVPDEFVSENLDY